MPVNYAKNITLELFDSINHLISTVFSFSSKEERIVKLDNTNYFEEENIKRSEATAYGWRYALVENNIMKNFLLIVLTFIIPFIELYFIVRGIYLVLRKTGRLYKYKKQSLHRRDINTPSYTISGWKNVKILIETELTQKEKSIQILKGVLMIVFGFIMTFSHHSNYGYSHRDYLRNIEIISSHTFFDDFNNKESEDFERQNNEIRLIIEDQEGNEFMKNNFHKIKLSNKNSRRDYSLNNALLRKKDR